MNLWVDDLRPAPAGWVWSRTLTHAIERLTAHRWKIMSLDHDLGDGEETKELILICCANPELWPEEVRVHSQNPPGKEWLEQMILRYHPSTNPDLSWGDTT